MTPNERPSGAAHSQLGNRDWLAERLRTGATYRDIATEAGVHPSTVSNWVKRHDLRYIISKHPKRPAPRGPSYPQLLDRDWLTNAAATGTVTDIADHIGCHPATVRRALQHFDLRAQSGRPSLADVLNAADLARWRGEGKTLTDIANTVGCDRSTVSKALKRHHLT